MQNVIGGVVHHLAYGGDPVHKLANLIVVGGDDLLAGLVPVAGPDHIVEAPLQAGAAGAPVAVLSHGDQTVLITVLKVHIGIFKGVNSFAGFIHSDVVVLAVVIVLNGENGQTLAELYGLVEPEVHIVIGGDHLAGLVNHQQGAVLGLPDKGPVLREIEGFGVFHGDGQLAAGVHIAVFAANESIYLEGLVNGLHGAGGGDSSHAVAEVFGICVGGGRDLGAVRLVETVFSILDCGQDPVSIPVQTVRPDGGDPIRERQGGGGQAQAYHQGQRKGQSSLLHMSLSSLLEIAHSTHNLILS